MQQTNIQLFINIHTRLYIFIYNYVHIYTEIHSKSYKTPNKYNYGIKV